MTDIHLSDVEAILPLLGDEVRILHPRRQHHERSGGGDFDCAVSNFDDLWPLRLPPDWQLLRIVRYDITGCSWVLDCRGHTVGLDTLDDPKGLGPYGFPTSLAFAEGHVSLPLARAAYLTAKRIRKGIRDPNEWEHIRSLSEDRIDRLTSLLEVIFGSRIARDLRETIQRGSPPDPDLCRRARVALLVRRIGSLRLTSILARSLARLFERVRRPTGLHVLIVGPDGAGKTTLAKRLTRACGSGFGRIAHFHWRPNLLPRLGTLFRSDGGDASRPHARPPHGRTVSLAALAYYWADFLLGSWLRIWPLRVRSGLVVLERGWWDIGVDPHRYRMRVPPALVGALGRLLPGPDVTLVLEAPPPALLERKRELPEAELARQSRAWHEIVPRRARPVYLDASRPLDEVVLAARDAIFELMEARAVARLGGGWAELPRRRDPRWTVPRGPRTAARSALSIYQPVTLRGLVGWEAARLASSAGVFRLLPRAPAPQRAVREALAPHLPPGGTVAVMTANHPGRYVALVVGRDGAPHAVAKVATDHGGREALRREASTLATLGPQLSPPLSPPAVLAQSEGLLLLEAIEWTPRLRPWKLPEEVAFALGVFFRASAGENPGTGAAHGDCAPWNLLRSSERWVLVDWEQGRDDAPPFFDIFHYLVQSHVLLRRRPARGLLDDLTRRRGPVGAAVNAYADGARIPARTAVDFLPAYLETSSCGLDPESRSGRAGLRARRELLAALGRGNR